MKLTHIALMCSGALLLGACGSDDDDHVDTSNTVAIDQATSLNLSLTEFDKLSGAVSFQLTDADNTAITGASAYHIFYIGKADPQETPTYARSWQRWHGTLQYKCSTDDIQACEGQLVESQPGQYQFTPDNYDWAEQANSNRIADYQVAIKIIGKQVTNQPILQRPL